MFVGLMEWVIFIKENLLVHCDFVPVNLKIYLHISEYKQFHLNQWTHSDSSWGQKIGVKWQVFALSKKVILVNKHEFCYCTNSLKNNLWSYCFYHLNLFIKSHLFSKYLLRPYFVPGTDLLSEEEEALSSGGLCSNRQRQTGGKQTSEYRLC